MEVFRRLWTTVINMVGSRKIVLAVCTFLAAIAAKYGLEISTEALMTAVGPVIAAILGIAWEDAAANRGADNRFSVTEITPSKN